MSVIWKYELEVTDEQEIELPMFSKVIAAACEGESIVVWIMLQPNARPLVRRRFYIRGTGQELRPEIEAQNHIATVPMPVAGQRLIWHVFDGGEHRIREAA